MARRVKNPFPDELKEPVLDVLRAYGWIENVNLFAEIFNVTPTQMAGFLRTKAAKAAVLDGRTLEQTKQMRQAISWARRPSNEYMINNPLGGEGENVDLVTNIMAPEVLAVLNICKERQDHARRERCREIQRIIRERTALYKDSNPGGTPDGGSEGNPG